MPDARIEVIGTGALATAICNALAQTLPVAADVAVVTAAAARGEALCFGANALAALSGSGVRFQAVPADAASERTLREVHAAVGPDLVVNCVSRHSPREEATAPSAWTALVERVGFGLTLPLQAMPAVLVGRALAEAAPGALLVNACYPDLVNPLLRALGLPILCGVGNANLVATALQDALRLPDQARLRVLAHHRHLYEQDEEPDVDARGWLDERPVPAMGSLLEPLRRAGRTHRNPVSGRAAATVIAHVLTGSELRTSLPGPLGLPGGYPVRVAGSRVELDLPPGLDRAAAVAWNRDQCRRDGVDVGEDGQVRFSAAIAAELTDRLPALAAGFHADRTAEACAQVLQLRRSLRSEPRQRG